jgi:hypothetical protein
MQRAGTDEIVDGLGEFPSRKACGLVIVELVDSSLVMFAFSIPQTYPRTP